MARRAAYYRIVFGLAAMYNLAFGLWSGFAPDAFFDLFRLTRPLYPSIWACLGMVVGTYGLGYAYAALRLDRAAPFIAIGLVGKVLGPIGWVLTVRSGEWPVRTFPLVLFNDLVWWLPFALFLIDGSRLGEKLRAAAAPVCAVLNAIAALAMIILLRPGTEVVPEVADDGVGGADASRGSGLRGLSDRVEALGGRLWFSSPPGQGTIVRAEIPCA